MKTCVNRQRNATQRTMNTNLHCTHISFPQHFFFFVHRISCGRRAVRAHVNGHSGRLFVRLESEDDLSEDISWSSTLRKGGVLLSVVRSSARFSRTAFMTLDTRSRWSC